MTPGNVIPTLVACISIWAIAVSFVIFVTIPIERLRADIVPRGNASVIADF